MYWIFLWRALKFKQIFTKNSGFMSISIQNFVVQSHLTALFTLITELIIPYASMKHFVFHMNSIHTFSIFWWCCWQLDCSRARTFDLWRALGSRNFHEIDRTKFDDFFVSFQNTGSNMAWSLMCLNQALSKFEKSKINVKVFNKLGKINI